MEATGRPIAFSGVNIFRFENGKVAEIWNHRDDLGLMTQLGAVTMNAGPARPRPDSAPRSARSASGSQSRSSASASRSSRDIAARCAASA